MHDVRAQLHWRGDDTALVDARDTIARIKGTLAMHAGVELTLVGADDQLTLTPNLEIFVYARTDRWLYLLQGKGLRRRGSSCAPAAGAWRRANSRRPRR
jgi:hypothetical protein